MRGAFPGREQGRRYAGGQGSATLNRPLLGTSGMGRDPLIFPCADRVEAWQASSRKDHLVHACLGARGVA